VVALAAPAGAPVAVDADLRELPVIDRALYTEIRLIERGGMGQTSQARDRRLGRPVAVKELRDDLGDRSGLARRLEREARLTARLQHPAIVVIYEAGRWSNGEPFYAMPLVRGKPLDAELRARRSLVERLLLVRHVITACEAIAYAHGQGVVHRDLKPANIMVGEFGETIVLDWGLAKAVDEPDAVATTTLEDIAGGLTQHGVGTPQYMPPEQARGESPGPHTDVYALGATLYHVLAGVPPYGSGESSELRRRLLASSPARLIHVAPRAPAELAAIVDKAMARDPAERFATARELAAELQRFQAGQLTLTHRYSPGDLVGRFVRRHRAAVTISSLAVALLATGAVVSARRVAGERDRATEGEAKARVALSQSQSSRASVLATSPATRLDALALSLEGTPQGLFDAVTAAPIVKPLARGGTISAVAFSPAGDRFAVIEGAHAIVVYDARTGDPAMTLASHLEHAYWIAWAPDGRSLAVTGLANGVELWDLVNARLLAMPAPTELVRFLADGTLVAASTDETARMFRDGKPVAELALGCTPDDVAMSGSTVWFGCSSGALVGWDGKTSQRRAQPDPITAVAADDRDVYTGSSKGEVRSWDVNGNARTIWSDPARTVYGLQLGPSWLSIGAGATILVARDGSQPVGEDIELAAAQPIVASAPRVFGIAYADHAIVGLDTARREPIVRLRGHRAFDRAFTVGSPDATRIVSVTTAGEAWLWDARLGALASVLPGHDGEVVASAAFGSHVRTLAVNGHIHEIDLATGAIEKSDVVGGAVTSVVVDGSDMIFGDADGAIHVWRRGGAIESHAIAKEPVTAVAMRGDVVAAGTARGDVVHLGDAAAVSVPGDPVTAVAVSTGWTASAHRSGLVQIANGHAYRGSLATSLFASPDGKWLAVGRSNGGELIDIATEHREALPGRPLTFASDGTLAIAGNAGALWLRRPSGAIHALIGHEQTVTVALFVDGALWSGDDTGELRRWSTALPWSPPLVITSHGEGAALTLAAVDRYLVVGFSSGTVRALPATADAARAQACAMLAAFGRSCGSP
jgi:WD40 repeat protein